MNSVLLATLVFTGLVLSLSLLVLMARALLLKQRSVGIKINQNHTIQALTGEKLLDQLLDANIAIPSGCAGAGTCGLCKVIVTQGGGSVLPTELPLLSAAEKENGTRLACQVAVREDLSITLPNNVLNAHNLECTVHSTRNLSPLIKQITLSVPDDSSFDFNPGAYITATAPPFAINFTDLAVDEQFTDSWQHLALDKLSVSSNAPVTRAYSIASIPSDNGQIVLLIRLALPPPGHLEDWPPGKVSSWLFSLHPGDSVSVSGPFGDFGLRNNERDIVLIGGGVGMAPLRAMLHAQIVANANRKIYYFYGARSLEDLIFNDEMHDLVKHHHHFEWTAVLSEPKNNDNWDGPIGFVHDVVREQFMPHHHDIKNCDYYLCGPPLMLQAVTAMLSASGIAEHQINVDDFGA